MGAFGRASRGRAGRGRASRQASATARPRAPSPRIDDGRHLRSPFVAGRDRRGSETQKSRGHRRGAAAPGASVPWRPRFVWLTRRLEPQGPCLPAGPPELLLRLCREEAAVHVRKLPHNTELMQVFSTEAPRRPSQHTGLICEPATRGGTYRPCPHPDVDAGIACVPPPPARDLWRHRHGGDAVSAPSAALPSRTSSGPSRRNRRPPARPRPARRPPTLSPRHPANRAHPRLSGRHPRRHPRAPRSRPRS